MTFFQAMAGKLLQKFLDPETVAKMFVSNRPDDPSVMEFIHPSQLEKKHGGTAPDVTCYWPPTVPEYKEDDFDIPEAPCKI